MSQYTETVVDNFSSTQLNTDVWTSSEQTTQTFTASGTFTSPANVGSKSRVQCWGAGAGGQYGSGPGGGSGEYSEGPSCITAPSTSYTIVVGTGGAGGTSSSGTGKAGGNTTSTLGSGIAHGAPANTTSPSTGGTGSTNTIHYNGAGTTDAGGTSIGGGGGAASAGTASAGVAGSAHSGTTGGNGGTAPSGGGNGGNGGNGGTSSTAGAAGSVPGGGGGAGGSTSTAGSNGGAGGNGKVIITYTPQTNILTSGTRLQCKATTAYSNIVSKTSYDISNKIVAVKWYAGSGTATSSVTFSLQLDDASGNTVNITNTPLSAYNQFQGGGSATISDSGSNSGLGTDLSDGEWYGIGMMGNDNVIHLYRSADDGATWDEIRCVAVGGTFAKTAVKIHLAAGYYTTSESPTWESNIAEVGVWSLTYRSSLYDDFSASSLDTTKWETFGDDLSYISTSSGACAMTTSTTYPTIQSNLNFDFSSGIMAFQYSKSGTATASCEFQFGIVDDTGANVIIDTVVTSDYWEFRGQNGASISNDQYSTDSLGTPWTNGTWLAAGNVNSDGVLHIYKSTDGVNFTEIGCANISGINYNAAGLMISNGFYTTSEAPTNVASIDNVTKLYAVDASANGAKVRVGGSWIEATVKVRVGGSWVVAAPKTRVGGSWVASS